MRLPFMHDIRKFYIETYHDQLFISPPAWFTMYLWMEALYHVPLSVWAVGALLRGMSSRSAGSYPKPDGGHGEQSSQADNTQF